MFSPNQLNEAVNAVVKSRIDIAPIVGQMGHTGTIIIREALEERNPILDDESRLRVAAAIPPYDVGYALKLDRICMTLL